MAIINILRLLLVLMVMMVIVSATTIARASLTEETTDWSKMACNACMTIPPVVSSYESTGNIQDVGDLPGK